MIEYILKYLPFTVGIVFTFLVLDLLGNLVVKVAKRVKNGLRKKA